MALRPCVGVLGILFFFVARHYEHGLRLSAGAHPHLDHRSAKYAGGGVGAADRESGVSGGAQYDDWAGL